MEIFFFSVVDSCFLLGWSWLFEVTRAFEIVGMGRISVAKKDSKIESLAVSAVFSAKLFV